MFRRPQIAAAGTVRSLFAIYAVVTLVPVILLGLVLTTLLNSAGSARGLSEGRAKADLIARTSIAPLLTGTDLRRPLSAAERADMARSVDSAIRDHAVLRLRLRNLDGVVVFSDDRSGGGADHHALLAASGQTISEVTFLNDDDNDSGPRGPRVVEVYEPLNAAQTGTRIGVVELYLPYAPIAADIAHGQRSVLIAIGTGLVLLWICLMGVTASVTRRLRRQSATNAFLASHDILTGLPNRTAFSERITTATATATAERPVAIGLLNLDRFRDVNDALGYANGDELIQTVAARLSGQLADGDMLARIAGDEFGIILAGTVGSHGCPQDDIDATLRRLRAIVNEPLIINSIPLTVEAGLGYVLAAGADVTPAALLRQADIALTVSKTEHRGVVRYKPTQDTYDASALILVAQLRDAISAGQLRLHYQPKGDLRSGRVPAVEALVRWQHPTRGLLYPDSFLGPLEQTGLIDDLTRWLLHTVCTVLPALDPSGRLGVAVNISARSLIRSDFAEEVITILTATGTDPARITLEITETALLVDPPRARLTLARLHDLGLRISIDDFGAGQTSLAHLATMPISELKIDKAFVMSMDADRRNASIVRSVIELGHGLGFAVTAEGVETAESLWRLRELGCDTVQGFLLARPAPAADLPDRIAAAMATLADQRTFTRPSVSVGRTTMIENVDGGARCT